MHDVKTIGQIGDLISKEITKYYVSNFLKIDILPKKAKAFCVIGVDYQKVKESVARIKAFKKNNSYKYRGIYDFG